MVTCIIAIRKILFCLSSIVISLFVRNSCSRLSILITFFSIYFIIWQAKQSIRLATGIDVAVFSADVRDYDALKGVLDEAGPIDVLVCNHGVFVGEELENQGIDVVKFTIDVNLVGTFNLIKAALPGMKGRAERGPGSIALMSSQAGQVISHFLSECSSSAFFWQD